VQIARGNHGDASVVVHHDDRSLEGWALEDSELVERAQHGDVQAYEELVQRHQELAVRTAYLVAGARADAEEVAQEAFVKAYYALPRFRPGAPFRPWLLRIVANEARNRRKAARRREGFALRLRASLPTDQAAPSPEEEVLASESRAVLLDALNALREEDRQAVAYRYFLGLSEEEMATALGCARGTVKSRLSRSLGRLRGALAEAARTVRANKEQPVADLPSRLDAASDADLERALADLGGRLDYPPTPDLSGAIRDRLAAGPTGRPGREAFSMTRRSLAWAALALVLLAGGLLLLSPDARRAVAERLGLPGVTITRLPAVPAITPAPSPAAMATPNSSDVRLGLGERLSTQADAQARVAYRVLAPTLPELATPDEVYLGTPPAGGQVALVYQARPGLSDTAETGVGLLFTQFRGSLEPAFFGKGLPLGTRLEQVTMAGRPAFWIEGRPHYFFYRDQSGRQSDERFRLAAHVLLWEQDGLTLRLEGAFSKEQALRIAASVR
jgi:RNA polymerase sigma factor (sigma-70 family)